MRGGVAAVTNASGSATAVNRYDEFGAPHANNQGRIGYTGQMRLTGFGLWRHRAQAYHPGMGRFLQADPIGYGDGMNMYAYVGGAPVNFADPTGLKRISAETKPVDMIVVHAVGPENAPISVPVLSGHVPPHASCGAT